VTRVRMLVVVGVWLVVVAALRLSNVSPTLVLLGGVVVAFSAVVFIGRDLFWAARTVVWTRHTPVDRFSRRNDPRVSQLRRQFTGDHWRGTSAMNDTLLDLVDDRLAVHHGIDRAHDPGEADSMLTPALRKLVTQPERAIASARELRRIVNDIEAL
jgi:hypothetical protein